MKKLFRGFCSRGFLIPFSIFIFALIIRTYKLSYIPFGFHMDEVSNTYIGRFILLNGEDIYGNKLPLLFFNKFGDFPPVLPMYFSGLATFVFGTTEFAARFPAAFFGSLIIFPLYSLVQRLISRTSAILSCLVIAILPWHVVLSRSSSEGIIALTFCTFGLMFLFAGIVEKKIFSLFSSAVFLFLTYFLYPSFRVLVPLIFLPLPFVYSEHKKIRNILLSLFCILSLLPYTVFFCTSTRCIFYSFCRHSECYLILA